jgi:hypothetical protein
MAFKLKSKGEILGINEELSSYSHPVFEKDLGPNIIAEANRDGTTFVDKNVSEAKKRNAIAEEDEHHAQMRRGELQYDDNTIIWKKDTKSPSRVYTRMNGRVIGMNSPADKVIEGAHGLPWEAAAKSKSYGK